MFNAYIAPVWDPYIRQHFHGDKIIEIGIILEFQVKLSVAVRLKSRGQERKFGIWWNRFLYFGGVFCNSYSVGFD